MAVDAWVHVFAIAVLGVAKHGKMRISYIEFVKGDSQLRSGCARFFWAEKGGSNCIPGRFIELVWHGPYILSRR